jgi:HNH endonuclease
MSQVHKRKTSTAKETTTIEPIPEMPISSQIDEAYELDAALDELHTTNLLRCLRQIKAEVLLLAPRFYKHVDKTNRPMPPSCIGYGPCLLWTGATQKGYAVMKVWRKVKRASHVAWFLAHGVWPDYLCHRCDNPLCVAIDHLTIGNPSLNAYDRVVKKRGGIMVH